MGRLPHAPPPGEEGGSVKAEAEEGVLGVAGEEAPGAVDAAAAQRQREGGEVLLLRVFALQDTLRQGL